MVVLGDMSFGGSVTPVENIAECLQVAFDTGAKKVALPMSESCPYSNHARRDFNLVSGQFLCVPGGWGY